MKTFSIRKLCATAAIVGIATFGASAPSFATDTPPQSCTDSNGNHVDMTQDDGNCANIVESNSSATSSVEDTAISTNGVDIHSDVTVVENIQEHGATAHQMRGKHFRLKHARTMWTSWKISPTQVIWHWKTYPKGKLFVKGKDGYWHDPKCWNKVVGIPHGKTHVGTKFYGKIKEVSKFSFSVTSAASVTDSAKAHAEAWANAFDSAGHQTCHAYGSGNGSASFFASASGTATGSVMSEVIATARGTASGNLKIKLKGKSVTDIHVSVIAEAKGSAVATASATAKCTTPTPPPPAPQKPSVTATTLNDLEQGQYSDNFCINTNLPNGDAGKVQLNTVYGSFRSHVGDASPITTINVSGVNRYCIVYYAPQDGTANSDLTEHVTVDLVDTKTGATADTYRVPDFVIKVPATHPA